MRRLFPVLSILSMSLLIVQCSNSEDGGPSGVGGGGGSQTTFTLVETQPPVGRAPAPGPIVITESYAIHCIDETEANCHTYVFEDVPDESGDWMSFPKTNDTCFFFLATVKQGDWEYNFTGQIVGTWGQAGPFVTGTYDALNGALLASGTFSWDEGQLSRNTTTVCPSAVFVPTE